MRTQARRRFLHSLTAVSIMFCSRPIQAVPGPVLILGAGRIVGAPSDWFKRSRDCDVGDPSFRTVFQTSHAQCTGYGRQNFVHQDVVVVPYFGICICFAFIRIYSHIIVFIVHSMYFLFALDLKLTAAPFIRLSCIFSVATHISFKRLIDNF